MESSNMHHVMFDIDGTLVESYEQDSQCFIDAVKDVTGLRIDSDWSKYQHVTDAGIFSEIMKLNAISETAGIQAEVKKSFLTKLKASLEFNPVSEVKGAASFLALLESMNNVVVSLATGGWRESALLKLESAGIDFSSIPLASSNDHYSRTEIMKLAASKVSSSKNYPCTYFGDGVWDKEACILLGFSFVLVGSKFTHNPSIVNFQPAESALACAGL